ncbi:MAG: cell division protein FtsQ/DivIB [Paracoccaceae bacterium]
MQPLTADKRPPEGPRPMRPAPGPSKFAYRLRRAWVTPWVRSLVMVYLPLAALGVAGWAAVAHHPTRLAIQSKIAEAAGYLLERPEFGVKRVRVSGATAELRAAVRRSIGPLEGASSLRLDLDRLRRRVEGIGRVATASVKLEPTGTLEIRVSERVPVALWRDAEAGLWLVDSHGVIVDRAALRADHPRLPLLLGMGAPAHVSEALALMRAAPDLMGRLRAFSRVGERRWDVVLDRNLVILLPEERAVAALTGIMALHYGEELFERDLVAVDLRIAARPALRIAPRAAERTVLRRIVDLVVGEDT